VARFPHFNGTGSVHVCIRVNRPNNEARAHTAMWIFYSVYTGNFVNAPDAVKAGTAFHDADTDTDTSQVKSSQVKFVDNFAAKVAE